MICPDHCKVLNYKKAFSNPFQINLMPLDVFLKVGLTVCEATVSVNGKIIIYFR